MDFGILLGNRLQDLLQIIVLVSKVVFELQLQYHLFRHLALLERLLLENGFQVPEKPLVYFLVDALELGGLT